MVKIEVYEIAKLTLKLGYVIVFYFILFYFSKVPAGIADRS